MAADIIFQPIRVGTLELPNRVLMTTIKLGYGTSQGDVTDRHIAFYVRRAEGGVRLITTEPMYIHPNGRELPTQLGIHEDRLVDGLGRLVDAVHKAGGHIMAHINHAGRVANPKLVPEAERVSASDVFCPANSVMPRPLSLDEIPAYVGYFAEAARRVRETGFDAIEIPFSHGYLIHQFLSPHTNRRDDEYGGSLEGRLRFGREIIAAVQQAVGEDFPIVVRMNARDYVEGGLDIEDAEVLAPLLEQMGINALSITSGTMCESVPYCLYPIGTPKANLPPMAARIRGQVSIPIAVAGRIRTPDVAREVLAQGQADWIGLGRPFLADPDWVRKAQAGDEVAILCCAACHQGCLAELRRGHGTSCLFNPMTGREAEVQIMPVEKPRRIMVVGGGPGGMEAALIAAQRGHHVSLYEKHPYFGGQFYIAAKPPHKDELVDIIRYLETQVRRAGVEIHLNTEVTPETVRQVKPDALVLATGGRPLIIPFPGLEEANWITAHALLLDEVEVTSDTVFVVGGGMVGLETADFLAAQGKQATVVEMMDALGGDLDPLARAMIVNRLKKQGVALHTNTKVTRLTHDTVIAQRGEEEVTFPVETVVMAVGARANRDLLEALAGLTIDGHELEIHTIGDAVRPRKALEAVYEGFEIGRTV